MIYRDSGPEDSWQNIRNQDEKRLLRSLDVGNPQELLSFINETLRAHETIYENQKRRRAAILQQINTLAIKLRKLSRGAKSDDRLELQKLEEFHRLFDKRSHNADYLLSRTRKVIDDLISHKQFVAETIKKPLTGKDKIIAAYEELNLRKGDLDKAFKDCDLALQQQESYLSRLRSNIQSFEKMLYGKISHDERQDLDDAEQIEILAQKYKKPAKLAPTLTQDEAAQEISSLDEDASLGESTSYWAESLVGFGLGALLFYILG